MDQVRHFSGLFNGRYGGGILLRWRQKDAKSLVGLRETFDTARVLGEPLPSSFVVKALEEQ
ncbi:hypothetical protein [Glutamicibacter sp. FBE19]|uniref:hypothetical protein n=1 Tax=Glutamicibacter sp. FBE19 TaxID=2761534 RepID=UPI0019D563E6|nr:hypothetical protein [Glutamicibacter sp. FBE19]MBF6670268.1 hypothetical protein [Glutamicibacter sp. FBE19]